MHRGCICIGVWHALPPRLRCIAGDDGALLFAIAIGQLLFPSGVGLFSNDGMIQSAVGAYDEPAKGASAMLAEGLHIST